MYAEKHVNTQIELNNLKIDESVFTLVYINNESAIIIDKPLKNGIYVAGPESTAIIEVTTREAPFYSNSSAHVKLSNDATAFINRAKYVEVCDNSRAIVYSALDHAYATDNGQIFAFKDTVAYGLGNSRIYLNNWARGYANDNCKVEAYDNSTVIINSPDVEINKLTGYSHFQVLPRGKDIKINEYDLSVNSYLCEDFKASIKHYKIKYPHMFDGDSIYFFTIMSRNTLKKYPLNKMTHHRRITPFTYPIDLDISLMDINKPVVLLCKTSKNKIESDMKWGKYIITKEYSICAIMTLSGQILEQFEKVPEIVHETGWLV